MIEPDVSLWHSLLCARNGQVRVLSRSAGVAPRQACHAALRANDSAAWSMVAVSAAHCGCWDR